MFLQYCAICEARGLVQFMWIDRKGFPHGSPEHRVIDAHVILLNCPQCQRGWLQRYSHDCWAYYEDEPWDMYWWFLLEQEDMQRLSMLVAKCPMPLNPQCSCDLHGALRAATENVSSAVPHEETPLKRVPYTSLSLIETEKGLTLKKK